MSIDQIFSHIKWTEWIRDELKVKIPFPIVADDMGVVAKRLGMIQEKKGTNTVRATFVMDPEAKVRLILYYPQEIGRNMDEILRAVKALQTSDKNQVAMPAGWPKNELVKDRVIVPPPGSEKEAAERLKQYECYDWWFCHKELEVKRGRGRPRKK